MNRWNNELIHSGVLGMKWGVRNDETKARYLREKRAYKKNVRSIENLKDKRDYLEYKKNKLNKKTEKLQTKKDKFYNKKHLTIGDFKKSYLRKKTGFDVKEHNLNVKKNKIDSKIENTNSKIKRIISENKSLKISSLDKKKIKSDYIDDYLGSIEVSELYKGINKRLAKGYTTRAVAKDFGVPESVVKNRNNYTKMYSNVMRKQMSDVGEDRRRIKTYSPKR